MKYCRRTRGLSICCLMIVAIFIFYTSISFAAETVIPVFSQEEEEYISSKRVLKVAILSSWKPYSYQVEDSYSGYSIYLLNRACEQTGLTLEFYPVDHYQEAVELRQKGIVDINAMEYDSSVGMQSNTVFVPYLEAMMKLIVHKNSKLFEETNFTAAAVEGIQFFDTQSFDQDNVITSKYSNMDECMNAVRTLRADFVICDEYTVQGLDDFLLTKDLVVIGVPTKRTTLGFGLPSDVDPALVSILQKVVETITESEHGEELMRHSAYMVRQNSFLLYIYQHPIELICAVIAFSLAVFTSLFAYTKVHLRQHKVLEGYEEGYRMLANTFGEMGLEYDYLYDRLTVFGSKCDQLDLPEVVEDFRMKLQQKSLRIMLSVSRFDELLNSSCSDRSYDVEFQCGMRDGSQNWFRMIYTVVSTEESHRRPIRLMGCLLNIEEEHQEQEQLKTRGMNDQLTGLLNRWAGEEQIEARLKEHSKFDTVVIIDLDYFKILNDHHGHLCGDAALRTFGELLQEVFDKDTILCRWGGDEFLLYCKMQNDNINMEHKFAILKKRMKEFQYSNQTIPITLSIGGTVVMENTSWEALFSKADEVLYQVKNNGRDHFLIQYNGEEIS